MRMKEYNGVMVKTREREREREREGEREGGERERGGGGGGRSKVYLVTKPIHYVIVNAPSIQRMIVFHTQTNILCTYS